MNQINFLSNVFFLCYFIDFSFQTFKFNDFYDFMIDFIINFICLLGEFIANKTLYHHYGLAAPIYTHFTSPIRRYADIIVHRLLAASIGVISLPVTYTDRTKLQEICTHMNRCHKAAQYVQRASVNMYTLLYFQ